MKPWAPLLLGLLFCGAARASFVIEVPWQIKERTAIGSITAPIFTRTKNSGPTFGRAQEREDNDDSSTGLTCGHRNTAGGRG